MQAKLLLHLLPLITLSVPCDAQWSLVNSGTSRDLHDIVVYSGNHVITCGDQGHLAWSLDAGLSWNNFSGFTEDFFGLDQQGSRVSACSEEGFVINSLDSGFSWSSSYVGTDEDLVDISLGSAGQIWTCGEKGLVFGSEDGGVSWSNLVDLDEDLNCIYFRDDLHGMVGGKDGFVAYTNDGGLSWINRSIPGADNIHDITYSDLFWISCGKDGLYAFSDDEGISWTPGISGSGSINSLSNSTTQLYRCNDGGQISFSTEIDAVWSSMTTPSSRDLHSLQVLDSVTGFACGDQGTLLKIDTSDSSVGISTALQEPEYQLGANPSNIFQLTIDDHIQYNLSIYDLRGTLVFSKSFQNVITVGEFLPAGMYFPIISDGHKSWRIPNWLKP